MNAKDVGKHCLELAEEYKNEIPEVLYERLCMYARMQFEPVSAEKYTYLRGITQELLEKFKSVEKARAEAVDRELHVRDENIALREELAALQQKRCNEILARRIKNRLAEDGRMLTPEEEAEIEEGS